MTANLRTSGFVVSAPARQKGTATERPEPAEEFLAATSAVFRGAIKTLPIAGSYSAKAQKLNPLTTKHLSLDEAAAILRFATDPEAVTLMSALLGDAQKVGRIAVTLPGEDMRLAELSRAFADLVNCRESRQARNIAAGVAARANIYAARIESWGDGQ